MAYGPHGRLAESWFGANAPTTLNVGTAATWVGGVFDFGVNGRVFGFRAYRLAGSDVAPVVVWFDTSGELLRATSFRDIVIGADGWQQTWLRPSHRINTAHTYRLFVLFPQGHYSRNNAAFASGAVTHSNITRSAGFQSTNIAPWLTTLTTNTNANGIDVLWQAD